MRQVIRTDGAPAPIGAYSQGLKVGSAVYVSGQLGLDPKTGEMAGSFVEQAARALANVRAILQAAGSDMSDVVRTTAYLADLDDFPELNRLYAEAFDEPFPAREAIQAARLPRGARVEISAVAVLV